MVNLPRADIETLAKELEKLGQEEAAEASLALLSSLLPYQLQLAKLSKEDWASPALRELAEDFTEYIEALREALLDL